MIESLVFDFKGILNCFNALYEYGSNNIFIIKLLAQTTIFKNLQQNKSHATKVNPGYKMIPRLQSITQATK